MSKPLRVATTTTTSGATNTSTSTDIVSAKNRSLLIISNVDGSNQVVVNLGADATNQQTGFCLAPCATIKFDSGVVPSGKVAAIAVVGTPTVVVIEAEVQ